MSATDDTASLQQRLRNLAAYLFTLASAKASASAEPAAAFPQLKSANESSEELDDLPILRALAVDEWRFRQLRREHFDPDFFGEPAWDMLLDLFVARTDGKRVSVTSACGATGQPSTTALRSLNVLERRGWVSRTCDSSDGRRSWLSITDEGTSRMIVYLRNRISTKYLRRFQIEIEKSINNKII